MCGIYGILSKNQSKISNFLLEGLERLSYRGYDSAGLCCMGDEGLFHARHAVGKIHNLYQCVEQDPLPPCHIGIGHTRWATHGPATVENAHPLVNDTVAVVHNGVIENYEDLKKKMPEYRFQTETDTEVVLALLTRSLQEGSSPLEAVRGLYAVLEGSWALGILFRMWPGHMVGVRRGSPMAVGASESGLFLGSDVLAMEGRAESITYLEDGDHVVLNPDGYEIFDENARAVTRSSVPVTIHEGRATKGDYPDFMRKEIGEQPALVGRLFEAYSQETASFPFSDACTKFRRFVFVACGSSFYAARVAQYLFEQYLHQPVSCELASEFRYRQPCLDEHTLYIFISQSGETIDTLTSCEWVKSRGHATLALVNVPQSSLARTVDGVWHLNCGPEIGVASTKAFMAQLAILLCVLCRWQAMMQHKDAGLLHRLERMSSFFDHHMDNIEAMCRRWAQSIHQSSSVLYLARGALYPIAQEGALKLKELAYIHAEGLAAGEMKHGPIALIDDKMPVIVLAPSAQGELLFQKTLSNAHEAHARGAKLLMITDDQGMEACQTLGECMVLPGEDAILTPLLYTLPMQLLAYHTALLRGCDVDQPRNLAKSVTVE